MGTWKFYHFNIKNGTLHCHREIKCSKFLFLKGFGRGWPPPDYVLVPMSLAAGESEGQWHGWPSPPLEGEGSVYVKLVSRYGAQTHHPGPRRAMCQHTDPITNDLASSHTLWIWLNLWHDICFPTIVTFESVNKQESSTAIKIDENAFNWCLGGGGGLTRNCQYPLLWSLWTKLLKGPSFLFPNNINNNPWVFFFCFFLKVFYRLSCFEFLSQSP